MAKELLDGPADIGVIRALRRDGFLSGVACAAACRVARPPRCWFAWADRTLLLFGATLILAGVIFFFAYNWSAMGRFIKLGLVEAGIIACVLAAHKIGRGSLSGKILLTSAAVLVGVLLAVFGQIYQTGADAYELFVGWAVLILGWVVISDFAALWLLWLVLVNTAAILYWQQVASPSHAASLESICLVVALLDGAALALYETGVRRGLEWLDARWLRGVLFAATVAALSVPVFHSIFDARDATGVSAVACLLWIGAAVAGYAGYRYRIKDMIPLALVVMSACAVVLAGIGRLMFGNYFHADAVMFLLFPLIVLGVVSAAAFWLKQSAATMAAELKEGTK